MLIDGYGRAVTDIRISVTKRCNFACVYCHDEGLGPVARPSGPHADEMSVAEIGQLSRIAREFDIRSVKFTGGEPLVRTDLEEIIAATVPHIPDVSLTTNGSMLARRARSLRNAGLKRVNVSMDSLDPKAFQEIRGGELPTVLRGIREALQVGLTPVKINMVVFQRTLPFIQEMIDFVGGSKGLRLQLIQFMPELVGEKNWSVDIAEVKRWLEERSEQVLVREMHRRRIYLVHGAEIEVVDPVRNPEFCMNCHRIRVTHRGELKGCLNRNDDLVPTRGLGDDELRVAFEQVVTNRVPYYGGHLPSGTDKVPGRPPLIQLVPPRR
jgi:cyclic pyranopterin phosphate synthase